MSYNDPRRDQKNQRPLAPNVRNPQETAMLKTIEVEIDADGRIHPLEKLDPLPAGRALLTLLPSASNETAYLAEPSLAQDWLNPEEDAAWAHLQPGK